MAFRVRWVLTTIAVVGLATGLGCSDAQRDEAPPLSTTLDPNAERPSYLDLEDLEESVGRPQLPEGLKAVVGRTTGAEEHYLWVLTKDGVIKLTDYSSGDLVAVGNAGMWVAYGNHQDRNVRVFQISSAGEESRKRLIVLGQEGDELSYLWMSPDEKQLLVSVLHPVEVATENFTTRLYLVDLPSGQFSELDGIAPLVSNERITAVAWARGGEAFYFSVGPVGGSLGEESFLCRLEDRSVTKLAGMATVLDVGPSGEVVGLEMTPPIEPPLPESQSGLLAGTRPLALSANGKIERLPIDQRLRRWSKAWFSPDGATLVVQGQAEFDAPNWENALEVLKREAGGWRITHLVRIPRDPGLNPPTGVGFSCGQAGFWMQDEVSEDAEGMPSGVWLGLLNTESGQYRLSTRLPGTDYSTAIGVASEAGVN